MDKSPTDPEAKEIINPLSMVWFHVFNEGRNIHMQSDLQTDVRKPRKQVKNNLLVLSLRKVANPVGIEGSSPWGKSGVAFL